MRQSKDHNVGAWLASQRQRFAKISMPSRFRERPEPLFIPKLQSRFADFPWTRYLLTRGFLPRRPDAVISTTQTLNTTALFHGMPGHARRELPRGIIVVSLRQELSSSADTSPLDWYDNPAAQTSHLKAALYVTTFEPVCRDLNLLPFRHLRWLLPGA
jgi:hypothetical protein